MKIEDLYLELGRAMTEKIQVGQEAKAKEQDLQDKINSWNQQVRGLREDTNDKQNRIQQHIDELQEAIKLASEGQDPCMAKMIAKESLEERRQIEKDLGVKITNSTLANTYYGNLTVGGGGGGVCAAQPFVYNSSNWTGINSK